MLLENGIWEFTDQQLTPPTNATQLAIHNQKDVKSRRIILDGDKGSCDPSSFHEEINQGNVGGFN